MLAWTRLLAVLALGCTIAIEAQAPAPADARTGLIGSPIRQEPTLLVFSPAPLLLFETAKAA